MLAADLMEFAAKHRPHGCFEIETGDLMSNGYRLTVECPCGVVFTRWITPQEAAEDLAVFTRRN